MSPLVTACNAALAMDSPGLYALSCDGFDTATNH